MILSNTATFNKKPFYILALIVVIVGSSILLGISHPQILSLIANTLWVLLLAVVIVFFTLGIMVMIGLKEEAAHLLKVLVEGSLSIIDVVDFIRLLIEKFIKLLSDFLIFVAPSLAFISAFAIYILFILLYKVIGRTYDVTVLTVIITVFFIVVIALMNTPDRGVFSDTWFAKFGKRFYNFFSDSLEIVLLIFFLTMDSTHLFFLPKSLNTPIFAEIGEYDLMKRSFIINDHLKVTLTVVIAAIMLEIIRNAIRLLSGAVREYKLNWVEDKNAKAGILKSSIRISFEDSKDDILKFITFTTIIISVFLIFPRLKLLTIAIASLVSLILDLVISKRLTDKRGEDLFSRVIIRVFKL